MIIAKPHLLVLDGQGVVFSSPIKEFLRRFSHDNLPDYKLVKHRWQENYRQLAWTGKIGEAELWSGLAGKPVDIVATMASLHAAYEAGPAAPHVLRWSRTVPVWLLSNHRSDWIVPKLDKLGVADAFQRLLISDLTGFVKPEAGAYRQLLAHGLAAEDILFVDDQDRNIESAKQQGLRTILADNTRPWLSEIDVAIGSTATAS